MKITLRYRWPPRAMRSFLGCMDIKTGVTIALLFALLNKVAGVYGLIAVFTGGSLAQLSLYVYSIAALVAFAWGLRAVSEEHAKHVLYFAHIFFADHLLSTIWTLFFGVMWWVYTPHDGKRQANSSAQLYLVQLANEVNGGNSTRTGPVAMSDTERANAAMEIWNKEKGFAAAFLIMGWCIKLYFILLVYSYALHLRKGSYRSLPLTVSQQQYAGTPFFSRHHGRGHGRIPSESENSLHEDDIDDMYSAPLRTPLTGASISSFTEFINGGFAGRGRKFKHVDEENAVDEVLFDDDERAGSSTPGGFHSRLGTEDSSSASSPEDTEFDSRPV